MEPTLPADATPVSVPAVDLIIEGEIRDFAIADTTHIIVKLPLGILNSITAFCAVSYNPNQPRLFKEFIGKALSEEFFGDEQQLQCMKSKQIRNVEYVGYRKETPIETPQVIVVALLEPVPGQNLKAVWKPAPDITPGKIRERARMRAMENFAKEQYRRWGLHELD
ncbi:uncharacterized protein BO88DRAFT_451853 [Aspergillus vadensis CBS 113365]|uniref:Uncharacterized protein n=1 Tax=Aspergillus vadensis (strain CBS 113365 / IMI 142717 / IBT 24658) TaxID=1448311 RepID=A0A319BGQ9_ASPVC|nr:hypothetical protein BO88DRAFT_451853 [Aspergillus vadensis CBS 113365]PYH71179.1 hypothetical protein BO88DRAFT_451853 [Aspergillus vadensis CBS 113365]